MASAVFGEATSVLQLFDKILERPVELIIHEDNQATMKVVEAGYSNKLRHISRTHKVNLGSLREILDQKGIKLQYIETSKQAADIFTKALEPLKWPNAIQLLGMSTHKDEHVQARTRVPLTCFIPQDTAFKGRMC